MTIIFTHRGLDPSIPDFPLESSYEAFSNQLARGFGLEFDLSFLADKGMCVIHDSDLSRLSKGTDQRKIEQICGAEFDLLRYQSCRLLRLEALLAMIEKSSAEMHALHFKGKLQTRENTQYLIAALTQYPRAAEKILIFDLYPQTAAFVAGALPMSHLACSISKPYDALRFNSVVSNTLLSEQEFLKFKHVFNWVWLDEWDTASQSGIKQEFYTQEVFSTCRQAGAKIALVSPELHASSPGLLAGESHQDAKTMHDLRARLLKILALGPDAICTDFPDMIKELGSSI